MTVPLDLLAVGAHPDDAEVGCGGVLILAADQGLRVGILDLTAGGAGTRGTPEGRGRERDRAAKLLGVETRRGLELPDAGLGTDPGHRTELAGALRDLRPRVVLAPYPEDRHPDHAAAGRLAREACFLAGVAKVGEGEAHRPARLYHYMLHHPFTPSFVVDVSSVWDRRTEAVAAYESQFGSPEPTTEIGGQGFLDLLEARATYHGAMIGAARGEPFWHPGPVPLTDLPGLDEGTPPWYGMFH